MHGFIAESIDTGRLSSRISYYLFLLIRVEGARPRDRSSCFFRFAPLLSKGSRSIMLGGSEVKKEHLDPGVTRRESCSDPPGGVGNPPGNDRRAPPRGDGNAMD